MRKGIDFGFAIVLGFIISFALYYATDNTFWRLTGPLIAIMLVTLFPQKEESSSSGEVSPA